MIVAVTLFFVKVKILSIFYFQIEIIAIFLTYDILCLLSKKNPATWKDFYENKRIFTWYSGIVHICYKKSLTFLIFLPISKVTLIIQIVVGIDLLIMSILKEKIPYYDNFFYSTFILIPGIYVKLLRKKLKRGFSRDDIKIFTLNFIFINLGLNSKIVVANTLVGVKAGESWKTHSYHPYIKIHKFIKLSRKYYFNEMIDTYGKSYTK